MSYQLLSEPIRKFIRNKRWENLRPIQAAAISRIIETDNNYVLASRTSSGKTEAAFLPILSKVDFNRPGVQILYISPLIALINDQFFRIEELCENLEISVTKWHGEAKKSLKNQLLKNPNGVLLITPESIEAMFVNAPYNVSSLLGNLHYIVIDEIHSFLGVDRGLQLMSLLSRIQRLNKERIITIGLSATIGDENYYSAKLLIGDVDRTKILIDRTKKDTEVSFKYFKSESVELPLSLLKELYKETSVSKALIFPNSRGRVEEIAVKLLKISSKVGGHRNYFAHHSSVDKEIRESIERFAKEKEHFNFCITCTSTLELGIDIGTIDKVVQVDSTHSVASLVQRVGRSGRREGEMSLLSLYATNEWSLLQSLACWKLYQEDFLEPIKIIQRPYDILFHQMLSIVKQLSGCSKKELNDHLRSNPTFEHISSEDIDDLINQSIKSDYLESFERELIIGVTGEFIVNSREFYSVFSTELNFKVTHSGKVIGNIPYSPQVKKDENILLAASIWKIKDVDIKGAKIIVVPAKDGKKPKFFGRTGSIHKRVRAEMLRILMNSEGYEYLNVESHDEIDKLRADFNGFNIKDFEYDRPVIEKEGKLEVYTFTGSEINNTIVFLFKCFNCELHIDDSKSLIEVPETLDRFGEVLAQVIKLTQDEIHDYIIDELKANEGLIGFYKWGKYLPLEYQAYLLREKMFDFEGVFDLLTKINLCENEI
ncbi:DEAD/DEAH box helicase [Fulvivirga maritima]|uniref:DEAD/DEAH box helicase n=1 Tax=Fulvivirga maritima TaxID=2904247 RepID=UPI001F2DB724|nr:DEAD/DEAH box helicase [Fulvivirga maritima]UII27553.1 DEAD/DEAH box helicase [Fulvivirga maritima]